MVDGGLARSSSVVRLLRCPDSARDDILLHRSKDRHQLALLAGGDLELVQALAEVLDQRVEMLALDAHAGMDRAHVAASVGAGAAGPLTDLLDQARLEPADIGVGEESV